MRAKEPKDYVGKALWDVIEVIKSGRFGYEHDLLINGITNRNDFYLTCHDFYDYAKTQLRVLYN